MERTGVADLPLHWGKAPKWLFERMVKLGKGISEAIILEYGVDEFLKRLSDPFWFQALACVLGWDFHSSGATTVTCAALKEAVSPHDLGVAVLGGKGKTSRRTPEEIEEVSKIFSFSTNQIKELKYASKICSKIDSAAIQDGFSLYHHTFVLNEKGKWVVIQQGMSSKARFARRYHWLSEKIESFVEEPHTAIISDLKKKQVLNMVAKESREARAACVDLVKEKPTSLREFFASPSSLVKYLKMTPRHCFNVEIYKKILKLHDFQPRNFEELLATKGIGPLTIRALTLISKVIYGVEPSWRDPVMFSFAHGGKDGVPYPVNRELYDRSTQILQEAIEKAKIGEREKLNALKKLEKYM